MYCAKVTDYSLRSLTTFSEYCLLIGSVAPLTSVTDCFVKLFTLPAATIYERCVRMNSVGDNLSPKDFSTPRDMIGLSLSLCILE